MQPVVPSATDVTVHIKIIDSTDFSPETGVTYATSGIDLWYRKGATGAKTSITEATQTVTGAHSDGGIVHVSDGVYRLDLPDAAVPTAEGEVTTFGGTVTGMQVLGGAIVGRVVPLAPTVAGRALDVSAGGEAGIDWANVGTPGSTVALSATTVATVTTTATATTLTNAPSDSSGTTTLLSRLTSTRAGYLDNLSAGAVATAANLTTLQTDVTTLLSRVTGAVSLATATTAAAIRSALGMAAADLDMQLDALSGAGNPWEVVVEGETFDDGTAGDILQGLAGGTVYATGSAPNTDAALSIRRGNTVAATIGDLTGLAAGWDSLWVTIKRSKHDADSAAILQVRLNTATPTLPGLVYINGQTPTAAGVAATDAWISDVDAGADTLVLNIKPAASLLLPVRGQLWWDVKMADGTTITSLATGEESAEITPDITRAIS